MRQLDESVLDDNMRRVNPTYGTLEEAYKAGVKAGTQIGYNMVLNDYNILAMEYASLKQELARAAK